MPSPIPAPPPYASATRSGVVSTGSQTFGGAKTFAAELTTSNGVRFGDGSLQLTAAVSPSALTLPTAVGEVFSLGALVAINSSGEAVVADSTVDGRFPAVGACKLVGVSAITVATEGAESVFSGLTPGSTHYLGTNGAAVTTPPLNAKVSQAVVQAYTSAAAIILPPGMLIYLAP